MATHDTRRKDSLFKQTPPAPTPTFQTGEECGVRTTSYPAIKNAPLPADGPGNDSFSNGLLFTILIGVPAYLSWEVGGNFKTTLLFAFLTTVPILLGFWSVASRLSPRINEKAKFTGRPVEHYLTFKNSLDRAKYCGSHKIPIETFTLKYFDGEVDFNGDALDVLEYRHDWASWGFTWSLFGHILFQFVPDVLWHSRSQDEEQVRGHYDRGDDFYAWFLGPRMLYTTGIISDPNREESLEELQDNKLAIICDKIGLKTGDKVLDIGCGWGTLATYASINYGAKVTGITLGKNQTAWGNRWLREVGIPKGQSQIFCMDYRDLPQGGKFDKITCVEMAEHVGIRRITKFFRQCYNLLEDDGVLYWQMAGLRKAWQYEDLNWGLFMNKYIFPGADASTPLNNYIDFAESAGWEVKRYILCRDLPHVLD
ncbi:hypothetical protein SLS53_007908 [Cytospora paraplurivora]|uniref:sphingolipid C(9)-methyltransferase n=1 Tax=Cytospora paraplurivora TaxID=2898453 RepID=A0AAN9TZI7_9PEZI